MRNAGGRARRAPPSSEATTLALQRHRDPGRGHLVPRRRNDSVFASLDSMRRRSRPPPIVAQIRRFSAGARQAAMFRVHMRAGTLTLRMSAAGTHA